MQDAINFFISVQEELKTLSKIDSIPDASTEINSSKSGVMTLQLMSKGHWVTTTVFLHSQNKEYYRGETVLSFNMLKTNTISYIDSLIESNDIINVIRYNSIYPDTLIVNDTENQYLMQLPIKEEEYFQAMTLINLANEEDISEVINISSTICSGDATMFNLTLYSNFNDIISTEKFYNQFKSGMRRLFESVGEQYGSI